MKTSIPKLHSFRLKGHENVVSLHGRIPPAQLMAFAWNEPFKDMIILGRLDSGDLYFSGTYGKNDAGEILLLLESGRKVIVNGI